MRDGVIVNLYPPLSRFIPARTFQVHIARGRDDSPQPQVIGQQDRRLPRRLPYQRRQGGVRSPHKSAHSKPQQRPNYFE